MSNNIILLLIDSMNNTRIKDSEVELTPFINSLKKKGMYCETMYSQAPYTEAANMSIYCGKNVLDNGGYMFRYKDAPLTIFEVMQDKGYETYYNDFQPQCHPSSVRRGVDEIYYSVGYDLGALWSYRLGHYARLLNENSLTDADFCVLREIFSDNLKEWIRFVDDVLQKDKSVSMIDGNAKNYDAAAIKSSVEKELAKYESNPNEYITDVLKKGRSHELFAIPAYFQDRKIRNREMMAEVKEIYKPLLKRIRRMDFRLNMKNCKGVLKGPWKQTVNFIKKPCKENMKNVAKGGLLSINQIYDLDLYERVEENYDAFKNSPSLRTHVDHYLNWRREKTSDKPHFAFMHVDDIHNPEVFFTYDIDDISLLKKEKQIAEEVLDKIPSSYHGSLTHDLSLRYIDSVIEYFFSEMEKDGYLEDTTVLICADHGFSFGGNPLRDSAVTNLFLENYNIPFVLVGPQIEHKEIVGLRQSKDIPVTLCCVADGNSPDEFIGHSVFEDFSYDSLLIEYCGGGCPDLTRRDIKMAAFDEEYFVGTLAPLKEPITEANITEVYNLKDDPKQLKNLVKEIDFKKLQKFVNVMNERRAKITESMGSI